MNRFFEEKIFLILMILATVIILGSLGAILFTVFIKGVSAMSWQMLTQPPKGGGYIGTEGGILNAILGSLYLGLGATFLALIVSLPIVFYLNLYLKKKSRMAFAVRFAFDVLWGIPSVVYGALGFTLMLVLGWQASLLAGTVTVALIVLPIMVRGMDEVIKTIPRDLHEAALSLGSTRWELATKVIFRQALPGILTAILLALGRAMTDAAAVLFTAGFTDSLPYSIFKPVATLPLTVFLQLGTPFPEVQARGYAAAFVLTMIVLGLSIASRLLSVRYMKHVIK